MYDHCINLFGVLKLVLLKVSVGAIVLQGLIENMLFSGQEDSLRAYCEFSFQINFYVTTALIVEAMLIPILFA